MGETGARGKRPFLSEWKNFVPLSLIGVLEKAAGQLFNLIHRRDLPTLGLRRASEPGGVYDPAAGRWPNYGESGPQ
jgi:hypothetical protein